MAKVYPPGLLLVYKEVTPESIVNTTSDKIEEQKTSIKTLAATDAPNTPPIPEVEHEQASQTSGISSFVDKIKKEVIQVPEIPKLVAPDIGKALMQKIQTPGKHLNGLYRETQNYNYGTNYFLWSLNLRTEKKTLAGLLLNSNVSYISSFTLPYITNAANLTGVALASVYNGYDTNTIYNWAFPLFKGASKEDPNPQLILDLEKRRVAMEKNQFFFPDAVNLVSSRKSSLVFPSLSIRKRLQFYINSPALQVKQESPGVFYVDVPGSKFDDRIYQGADTKPTIKNLYPTTNDVLTILKLPTGKHVAVIPEQAVLSFWPAGTTIVKDVVNINWFKEGTNYRLPNSVLGVIKALKVTNNTSWPISVVTKSSGWNHTYPQKNVSTQLDNVYMWFLPVTTTDHWKTFSIDKTVPYGHKSNRVYLNNVKLGDLVRIFYHNEWQAISEIVTIDGKKQTRVTLGYADSNNSTIQGMVISTRILASTEYNDWVIIWGQASGGVHKEPPPPKKDKEFGDKATPRPTEKLASKTAPPKPQPIIKPAVTKFYQLNFGDIANPDGAIQKSARFGFGVQKLSLTGHARKTVQQTRGIIQGDTVKNNFFVDTFWVGPETIQLNCVIEMPYAVNVPIVTQWFQQPGMEEGFPIETPPGPMSFYQAINQFYLWNSHPERVNRGDELWLYDYSIADERTGMIVETKAYKLSWTMRSWADDVNEPNIKRLTMEFTVLDYVKPPVNADAGGAVNGSYPDLTSNVTSNSQINQSNTSISKLSQGQSTSTKSPAQLYEETTGGDPLEATNEYLTDFVNNQLNLNLVEINNFPSLGD